jgi:lysophospholipid acyltransferase (LPLAT)-like uncharacterized protein
MATPAFIKGLSRNAAARGAATWLIRQCIRFAHATGRWRTVGVEHVQPYWTKGGPAIVCFWHGRLMMLPYAWQSAQPFHMLHSPHADGQLIAAVVRGLGMKSLFGSSRRGGSEAFRRMVSVVKEGGTVGITPDGPHGPRMRAGGGAVTLARLTGAPLLPLAFGCRPRRLLRTWDRLALALPFGEGVFVWGAPITVARDADDAEIERARLRLEDGLNAVTFEADRLMGQVPVEPAPLASDPAPMEAHP